MQSSRKLLYLSTVQPFKNHHKFPSSYPLPHQLQLCHFLCSPEAQFCAEVYPGKQHRRWSFIKLMKHDSIALLLKNMVVINQLAPGQKISQESRKSSANVSALDILQRLILIFKVFNDEVL